MNPRKALPLAILATAFCTAAFAQQPPAAPPTAPAAAAKSPVPVADPGKAPAFERGRGAGQPSTLHGFAIIPTGRQAKDLPIDKLKVPPGFKVEVWVDGVPASRQLALGDKGTVFVGNWQGRNVYAIVDRGGKREVITLLKGLDAPNGVAFHKGTLYVAERHRITRYDGVEDRLDNPPEAKVVVDGLDPDKQPAHFWKFLAMGPDGKLYFNVGAPGNIVMPKYTQATIARVDPQSGTLETVAMGVRNSVGFDWHPKTKQLWFTEHGRDWLAEDLPSDELNVVKSKGEHFGYPYCHADMLDPEFGKNRSCSEFTAPVLKLGAHISPIGMRFYTGKMFPAQYRNNIFIAMRGGWNSTIKQGFNVTRVSFDSKGRPKAEPFLTGFLVDEKADPPMWGRPVDVLVIRDGSMLVSDHHNGIIYRVSYAKQ
jgi:glucose/arabinose dehydrogenase